MSKKPFMAQRHWREVRKQVTEIFGEFAVNMHKAITYEALRTLYGGTEDAPGFRIGRWGYVPKGSRQYHVSRFKTFKPRAGYQDRARTTFGTTELGGVQDFVHSQMMARTGNIPTIGHREREQDDILVWYHAMPVSERVKFLKDMGVILEDYSGIMNAIYKHRDMVNDELGGVGLPLFDWARAQVQHETMDWFQHNYMQLLKEGQKQGAVFTAWARGLTELVKDAYTMEHGMAQVVGKATKAMAERMAEEWRNAMGTVPGNASYWFYGVHWAPLSDYIGSEWRQNKLAQNPFRVNVKRGRNDTAAWLSMGHRARRRMFWSMSGELKRAIVVKEHSKSGRLVAWSVGLDPNKMHNRYNSKGQVVGRARIRTYTGHHHTSQLTTDRAYRAYDWRGKRFPVLEDRDLDRIRNAPELHVDIRNKVVRNTDGTRVLQGAWTSEHHLLRASRPGQKARTWTSMVRDPYGWSTLSGKSIDDMIRKRVGRAKHATPALSTNPIYGKAQDDSSVFYRGAQIIAWGEEKHDPVYKTRSPWNPYATKTEKRRLRSSMKSYWSEFYRQQESGTARESEGISTGRSYTGSAPTLLQKFLWNEYGFARKRVRTVHDRQANQMVEQSGMSVTRPIFGPLMRKYAKEFKTAVLSGTKGLAGITGTPMSGGLFQQRTIPGDFGSWTFGNEDFYSVGKESLTTREGFDDYKQIMHGRQHDTPFGQHVGEKARKIMVKMHNLVDPDTVITDLRREYAGRRR